MIFPSNMRRLTLRCTNDTTTYNLFKEGRLSRRLQKERDFTMMYVIMKMLVYSPLVKVVRRSTNPHTSTYSPEKSTNTPLNDLSWSFKTCNSTNVSKTWYRLSFHGPLESCVCFVPSSLLVWLQYHSHVVLHLLDHPWKRL